MYEEAEGESSNHTSLVEVPMIQEKIRLLWGDI